MYGMARQTADGGWRLRFQRRLNHPVERVWSALTAPDRLVEWLAEAEMDVAPGGRIQLRWLNTDPGDNTAAAQGKIIALEPLRRLVYDTDIHGRLAWEVRGGREGCVLMLTVDLGRQAEQVEMLLAGWHIHLDHLAAALDGRAVDWPHWMRDHFGRWTEYRDHYAAVLHGLR